MVEPRMAAWRGCAGNWGRRRRSLCARWCAASRRPSCPRTPTLCAAPPKGRLPQKIDDGRMNSCPAHPVTGVASISNGKSHVLGRYSHRAIAISLHSSGARSSRASKYLGSTTKSLMGVSAVTVAGTGLREIRLTSPKKSFWESRPSSLPQCSAFASPSRIMMNSIFSRSSLSKTLPAGCSITSAMRAISAKVFLLNLLNRGTFLSSSSLLMLFSRHRSPSRFSESPRRLNCRRRRGLRRVTPPRGLLGARCTPRVARNQPPLSSIASYGRP